MAVQINGARKCQEYSVKQTSITSEGRNAGKCFKKRYVYTRMRLLSLLTCVSMHILLLRLILPHGFYFVGLHQAPDTFKITKAILCAGLLEGGKDACWGDSGGPLIAKGETDASDIVFGLTSFGEGCAQPATPGGYANVRKYSRWIQRKVRQHSKFVNE